MPHTFTLPALQAYYVKTPMPDGANKLVDQPGDMFLDTEDEMNVIAASLWVLTVKYDEMDESQRPKTKDELRRVSYVVRDKNSADFEGAVDNHQSS